MYVFHWPYLDAVPSVRTFPVRAFNQRKEGCRKLKFGGKRKCFLVSVIRKKMQFLDQNVKSHDATQNLITNIDDKQL